MKNTYPLCFWKLRDREPEVHVLGSLHSVSTGTYPLADHIERAIDHAEVAVFEVDGENLSASAILENSYNDPISERLRARPQLFIRLQRAAESYDIDLARINDKALWLVALYINAANLKQLGKPMATGVDHYVRDRCKDRMQFEDLEAGNERIAGLTSMSPKGQTEFLESILDEIADRKLDGLDKTECAWRNGNVEYFARANTEEARKSPEQHKILHIDRNVIWTKNIRRVLEMGKRTLVVGGAAHFMGEGSVFQLLKREDGIRVDRIVS